MQKKFNKMPKLFTNKSKNSINKKIEVIEIKIGFNKFDQIKKNQ